MLDTPALETKSTPEADAVSGVMRAFEEFKSTNDQRLACPTSAPVEQN